MSRTWHRKRAAARRGSRAFDTSCRCHGGCPWCLSNRMHRNHRRLEPGEKAPRSTPGSWVCMAFRT